MVDIVTFTLTVLEVNQPTNDGNHILFLNDSVVEGDGKIEAESLVEFITTNQA